MVDQGPSGAPRAGSISISPEETEEAIQTLSRILKTPTSACPAESKTADLACRIYAARSERRHFFDEEIFSDPAWDMLLVLYCSAVRNEKLSVTSVVRAATAPYTTGLRWLGVLEKHDLVRRESHPRDKRANFVVLTAHGKDQITRYIRRIIAKHLDIRA